MCGFTIWQINNYRALGIWPATKLLKEFAKELDLIP
jgi:hypothetical protein